MPYVFIPFICAVADFSEKTVRSIIFVTIEVTGIKKINISMGWFLHSSLIWCPVQRSRFTPPGDFEVSDLMGQVQHPN